MSASEPELTIVVMAYNEAVTLPTVVTSARAVADRIVPAHEILIVDDGSDDGTEAAAASLAAADPLVRVVRHPRNGGLGAVYRTGFTEARGRLVTFIPADGQFPAENIRVLYHAAQEVDAVFGYLANRPDGAVALALSWVERALYTALVGRLPRFQGMLMFRRAVLADVDLRSHGRGWGVVMELVLALVHGGYATRSVLTEVRPRAVGKSKVRNVRTVAANLRQLAGLSWSLRRSQLLRSLAPAHGRRRAARA